MLWNGVWEQWWLMASSVTRQDFRTRAGICLSTSAGPEETLRVKVLTVLAALAPTLLLSTGCHEGLPHNGTRARLPKSPLRKAGKQSAPVADGVRRRIVISL